jgi:transcription-repair coupling factor (superfamily II helicase)
MKPISKTGSRPDIQETVVGKTLFGAPEGQDARILADLAREASKSQEIIVHIALDDGRVDTLHDLFQFFAPDVEVIEFPAWDCLPYDRVSPSNDIVARRVSALTQFLSWAQDDKYLPRIVILTVNSAVQKVTPPSVLKDSSFLAQKGSRLNLEELQTFLTNNGYIRTETVREAGEFAVRGGIIDVFPPSYESPVRIDLFGDEIESIRAFDAMSQRTESKLDSFILKPVTEFFLDDESITRFRKNYRETFGMVRDDDPLYTAVSEGRRHNGMDHWLPFFFEEPMANLFDYLPACQVTCDPQVLISIKERLSQIEDFYQARKTLEKASASVRKSKKGKELRSDVSMTGSVYHPLPVASLYNLDVNYLDQATQLSPFKSSDENASDGGGKKGRDFADIRAIPDSNVMSEVKAYIERAQENSQKALIATYSEGARDRLKIMLKDAGFDRIKNCHTQDDIQKIRGREIGMAILALENGFVTHDLCVLSEQDILGDRLARKAKKRRKAENFLTEVSSLDVGDLVVHVDHGVGRFEGLETLSAAGTLHDCLKIIYAGDDKLFVPVENIEVLSRFGSDEGFSQLDKLGGAGWQARKAKVKKDLMRIADHLMKIAAARVLRKGEKLVVDPAEYNKFSARFPYSETEDQLRSINAVIEDLNGDHPMDRLICGDVGFGKTEVALRAAYVAAMAGVQVAVAVPTTLLARQHYAGFVKRFEGLGIRVGQLSRMVSASDVKLTKDGLADGSVNIVIGTHAIFAKDVKFAHLGLVIVDEEQRFGVKQKERLKELKTDVHILTLTATPIPRTLQMSLTGVKEMSLITTPPIDRLAIRTFVLPYDQMVIREALMREHYRGGQSFYVVPRIKDLKIISDQLKELVPELKFVTASGQMTSTELENRMSAFYDGQYDILLATNIIESGLDIPTANTMVVHRSDMFGLAQLYQIRGRIGRSKVRAYAYLTHDPLKKLTPQGQKRLEVIETLDTLGAGFQLASHDMDIRGAGNLLGEEQSGHIREVGVELYQQMLEEAVALAKSGVDLDSAELVRDRWSPQINIGTSVLIPETYVEDLSIRMSLYRRLSELDDAQEIEDFAAELIDRFGDIPQEVENLMDIVAVKQLCRKANVSHVEAGPKGAVIGFHKGMANDPAKVMQWIAGKRGSIKIRPKDQKIIAVRNWETPAERVKGVQSLIKELAFL